VLIQRPFIFLRHGATDWLRERRVQGKSDVRLNARGIEQAKAVRDMLRGRAIGTICTSPLTRALETAEIVNALLRRPVAVIDELKECNLGSLEGQIGPERPPHWLRHVEVPGAETYDTFIMRALAGINKALAHPGPVLIVAHGGVYWAVQIYADLDRAENISSCVPVLHEPPRSPIDRWTARLLN
jgi:broad specificity phosphatase PhoE